MTRALIGATTIGAGKRGRPPHCRQPPYHVSIRCWRPAPLAHRPLESCTIGALPPAFDTLSTELAVAIQRESGAPDSDPSGGRLALAKLFAQLHRCSQSALSQPSAITEALLVTPALEELCWMAYSGESAA